MADDAAVLLTQRYNRDARAYRDLWAPVLRVAELRLLSELAGPRVERVVDVGAGVGALLPDLRAAFPAAAVIGVDRARGMLALGPADFPRAVMDATGLGIRDESVDLVFMAFMLFHLSDPLNGLREARRVLRRGGRVATLTWAGDLETKGEKIWSECLDAHGAAPADQVAVNSHDPVDSPAKMEALLASAGFGSARCWQNELACPLDLERFLLLKTSVGSSKRRFETIAPERRDACVASGRERMQGLTPEDLVVGGNVVYSIGCV